MTRATAFVVVIGASAGGVEALLELAAVLPRHFPAPVCIVQHVGKNQSILPELLGRQGPNLAVHADDRMSLAPGTLYVARPDHHLMIEDGHLRLSHGPKENHARPAIDPLFRSAAVEYGPCAIGIVLSGYMDDGTAGLQAIKECGGTAIVQDPGTAAEPEMPRSALRQVAVDHCVPVRDLPALLLRLMDEPADAWRSAPPQALLQEVAIARGDHSVDTLSSIAEPSPLTCPDCHGSLWEQRNSRTLRYRCHLGHAYSAGSLLHAQNEAAEAALWNGVRALREREMLLRRFAALAERTGDPAQAAAGHAQADRVRRQVEQLAGLTGRAARAETPSEEERP